MLENKTLRYPCILVLFLQLKVVAFEQHLLTPTPDSTSNLTSTQHESIIRYNKQIAWHSLITDIPSDYSVFANNSFRIQEIPDYLTVGALTGSLLLVDETTWRNTRIYYKKSQNFRNLSDIAVKMGDGRYQFLTTAIFTAPGLIFHDETAFKTGSNIAEAIISTGLLVQVLKRITGRQSPAAATESGGDWEPLPSIKQYQQHQPSFYSFPSGHLSTATAIFTVIANNYPDEKWIRPFSYPILGLLSASLVGKGMHWYSDLPLAYFLGYSFGNIIAPEKDLAVQVKSSTLLSVNPSINYNGLHIGLLFKF